jgi:putative porin
MPAMRWIFCAASTSALLVFLLLPTSLRAQSEVARTTRDATLPVADKPNGKPNEIEHRVEALEEQLRQQSEKLDKLMALVVEQQRVIAKLASNDAAPVAASHPAEVASATADATRTSAGSQPSVDDRIKKLDEQVHRIGPFRFSGDFRLRFDGIFRSAEPNPPAGFTAVTHQQNARMRYRFRFNFDTDINPKVSFHGQLATGPINNALTMDQDFASVTTRHPFFISEAWIDYHPNKSTQLQGGRVLEIFADNSRFLFDDDIRFNGFNEKYVWSFKNNGFKASSLEFRAGQYILSNPNVAIVTAGSPLALAGDKVGSTGRAANLFHQGLLLNQKFNDRWSSQMGGDVQIYRNPNQIQLASTTAGVPLIVQNGLGITLSGPVTGTGNATTTNGGAIYTARNFQIARVTYRLNWAGWKSGSRTYPVVFNIQAARNIGIGLPERDALLASFQVGRVANHGDVSFLYVFSSKGANSMISQVTDDDLGTNTGVNIRTHHLRFDYGIAKKITWQSLLYIQSERRSSGDFLNFFVPLNAFTPRQYRLQEQIVFSF